MICASTPVQKDCYACTEYNYDWFCNDIDEPYTTPAGKPFTWQGRMRVTGGRTNVWGRQSYRLSAAGPEGLLLRRPGRRLAARLQGSRSLLRAGRGLRRHLRHDRERIPSCRTASSCRRWPMTCAEDEAARPHQAEVRAHAHHRPRRPISPSRSTAARPATTAGPANAAA